MNEVFASIFFADAIAALMVAALLLLVRRSYPKNYLSKLIYAVLLFALGAATNGFAYTFRTAAPWLLEAAASIWFGGALATAIGIFTLISHRPPARRRLIVTFAVVGAAAVLAITLFVLFPQRGDASIALMHAMAAGTFLYVSVVSWRNRSGDRKLALTLVSISYAFVALAHLTTGFFPLLARGFELSPVLPGAYTLAGLTLLLVVFEDERESALLAASQIELLAYHDSLTGLPNRSLFFDRVVLSISQAERYSYRAAVLLFDLDRFKEVNDSLGHNVGDSLLRTAGDRAQQILRSGDTIARFGGDEFIVLLPRVDSADDAVAVAHKILRAFRAPVEIGSRELVVTTSVGIAIYPDDGTDPESLIRSADAAMYRAKERGRDQYELFAPAMSESALAKLELETRLRRALENGELELHYQPMIGLTDHSIFGVEALLRWKNPEYGYIPPQRFVEAAEISGIIIEIGEWALKEACRQVARWRAELKMDLSVAVNFSPRQFRQPDIVLRVQRALAEAQLPPSALEIEITESTAIDDADAAIDILRALKSIGVRIALDDFGTGYASLRYLQKFPVDTLKLHQSFVAQSERTEDKAIIQGVIAIAHGLGMRVIAEGVENEQQLEMLKESYCDVVQGYLFTQPLPPAAFTAFIRQHRDLVAGSAPDWAVEKASEGESRRALVVDDDPAIRALVKRVLERARFSVDVARNGQEGLEALSKNAYAAIFLDITMPEVDGYQVISALKETNPMALRRVVVMTAIAPTALERLSSEPIARVLPKPFDINQIIATANDVALVGMTG